MELHYFPLQLVDVILGQFLTVDNREDTAEISGRREGDEQQIRGGSDDEHSGDDGTANDDEIR